jgi:hypothetical protein
MVTLYSITSSARCCMKTETFSPSAMPKAEIQTNHTLYSLGQLYSD